MEKTSIDIDNRETLDKISTAIMCFMRGKYRLDEISDGKNELSGKAFQSTYRINMITPRRTMMESGCTLMSPPWTFWMISNA